MKQLLFTFSLLFTLFAAPSFGSVALELNDEKQEIFTAIDDIQATGFAIDFGNDIQLLTNHFNIMKEYNGVKSIYLQGRVHNPNDWDEATTIDYLKAHPNLRSSYDKDFIESHFSKDKEVKDLNQNNDATIDKSKPDPNETSDDLNTDGTIDESIPDSTDQEVDDKPDAKSISTSTNKKTSDKQADRT